MGTKVQQTSDMLGYYTMMNSNDDANGNWSSYHEDKNRGCLYDDSLLRPLISFSNHERHIVKQTMLEHEASFRRQVSELHFLYKRQKDLMEEFQMADFLKHSAPEETSQSNSLSSHVPSEISERTCQKPQTMHQLSLVTGASSSGVFFANNAIRHLDFQKETNIPSSGNGVSLNDCKAFALKAEVSSNVMFDLELPAGEQIDCDAAIGTEKDRDMFLSADKILEKNREAEPESNVKLTLGPLEDPCKNINRKPDEGLEKKLDSQIFIDLNEPLKGAISEGSAGPSFIEFSSQRSGSENFGRHHFTMKSTTRSMSRYSDSFGHKHKGKGNLLDLLSEEKEHERLYDKGLCGNLNSHMKKINPMSYEATHSMLKKTDKFHLPDQCNNESWFGEKTNRSIHSFDRAFGSANSNDLGHVSFHSFCPFSALPNKNFNNPVSAAFPSSRMPANGIRNVPVAVQALPCTNDPYMDLHCSTTDQALCNSESSCIKWHSNAKTRLKPKVVSRSAAYQNGFQHPSSCIDKPDLTINRCESAYSTGPDVHWSESSHPFVGRTVKGLDSKKPMRNGVLEGFMAQKDMETHDINQSQKQPSGVLPWLPLHMGSVDIRDHTSQLFSQSYHKPFSIWDASISDIPKALDRENNSVPFLSNVPGLREMEINPNSLVDPKLDKSLGKKAVVSKNHIDLNADIPYKSDTSHRSLATVFAPAPSSTAKVAFMNDLKAPSASVVHNSFSLGQSTSMTNEFLEECAQQVAAHLAAESIVALSRMDSRMDSCTANLACHDPLDSLNVLGKIVLENAHKLEYSDNEGSDSFEALTLKLEETKIEAEWPKPKEPENTNKNEKSVASLLMKTRRGLARRRRQKRDFQKEILPVISTLSKREASEDIKALGGLQRGPKSAKAMRGKVSRQTVAQRPRCQAAVREVPRNLTMISTPPINVEQNSAGGASASARGATTRRCKRQKNR